MEQAIRRAVAPRGIAAQAGIETALIPTARVKAAGASYRVVSLGQALGSHLRQSVSDGGDDAPAVAPTRVGLRLYGRLRGPDTRSIVDRTDELFGDTRRKILLCPGHPDAAPNARVCLGLRQDTCPTSR